MFNFDRIVKDKPNKQLLPPYCNHPDYLLDNNPIRVYDVYEIYNWWMNSKELIKALEKDGWVLRSSRGSHHVFNHPCKAGHITVPHPKKDLGVGLVQKLLKQAGIK